MNPLVITLLRLLEARAQIFIYPLQLESSVTMNSVVMVAYHFPPEGNAGSYRPLRFVRHLPSRGWEPTVVTVETDSYERYDPSLTSLVPSRIEVVRVRNRDPWQALQARRRQRVQQVIETSSPADATRIRSTHNRSIRALLRKAVHSVEACAYSPDVSMGWIEPAVKAVMNICRRKAPNVIWATAGPVSAFVVAEKASKHAGVPYVLDFRDAWTIIPTEFDLLKPRWARVLEQRRMFRLLAGARAVVFRYETEAECFWRAYPGALDPSRIFIIPNGFEGRVEKFTQSAGNKLNILYAGTLPDYRYDTLLQALCSLKESSPDIVEQLHLRFIGEGTEPLEAKSSNLGLQDVISTARPVSHQSVTKFSREADALLVLGRPSTMKGFELFAAAKLFGYLKTGRPIVGILPDDEAKKILVGLGVSTIASVDSLVEVSALIRKLVLEWKNGRLASLIPDPIQCAAYSAERQTEILVSALQGKSVSHSFVPGRVGVPISLQKDVGARQSNASGTELLASNSVFSR
jgi:glycosyltransferase involved in cell wall biosynthesis